MPIILNSGVSTIIFNSGAVAKVILAILTFFSVISWAITIEKIKEYRRCQRDSQRFLRRFPDDFHILNVGGYTSAYGASNLPYLLNEAAASVEHDVQLLPNMTVNDARPIAERAKQAMERQAAERLNKMEKYLSFLATTASVSPFLGLFGTVWGVMHSFLSMGQMGSASLTVVGPGVAEALITTVFGLGAAIPAVVAYNWAVNFTRREAAEMESFISRASNAIEREILRELNSTKVSI